MERDLPEVHADQRLVERHEVTVLASLRPERTVQVRAETDVCHVEDGDGDVLKRPCANAGAADRIVRAGACLAAYAAAEAAEAACACGERAARRCVLMIVTNQTDVFGDEARLFLLGRLGPPRAGHSAIAVGPEEGPPRHSLPWRTGPLGAEAVRQLEWRMQAARERQAKWAAEPHIGQFRRIQPSTSHAKATTGHDGTRRAAEYSWHLRQAAYWLALAINELLLAPRPAAPCKW